MEEYTYMNQDMWLGNENPVQYQYYNDPYNDSNNDDPYDDRYDDDCWWSGNSAQSHHHESSCLLYNQESDKSSFRKKLDQMLDMLNETFYKEDENSKSISTLERQIEQISEKLNQHPPGNLSYTTQDNEVTILCSDKYFDNKVHNFIPLKLEAVVHNYVPLYDNNTERIIEIKEVVIEKEKYNEEFHVSKVTKVGEASVEANTTHFPTTFKKHQPQLLVMDSKKVAK